MATQAPVKVVKSLRLKGPSPAVQQALSHVKDFMTDVQKSFIMLREGRALFDNGHFQDALECFNEAISFHPSVTLFNMRAACHKQLELFNEAYFDYSYSIRLEPEVGVHYCNRGLCLAKLKKLNLAIEDLNLAILYEPSGNHFFTRGVIFSDFGKFQEAVDDFSSGLKDDSQGGEFKLKCRYRRALSYFDLQQFDQAIADATIVLNNDPNSVPARSLLGRAFKTINEYQKAEEQLTNAILIDESQAALYTERGDIRFRTNQKNKIIQAIYDFDKAINLIESKIKIVEPASNHSSSPATRRSMVLRLKTHSDDEIAEIENNRSPQTQRGDLELQLADVLYKRAQAKLLIESDESNIESALVDALRAMTLGNDEDYELVTAACYIRLKKYQDAVGILEKILQRSPKNFKALYNLSFCRRAAGSQKDAIADLSKIISMNSSDNGNLAIPVHRVYEMRGTLFHEVQAHKLALNDLGKAIAINPSHAGNYFLRGDCQYKLGNYEQALQDYNQAELKGFQDFCALFIARGMTRRVVKDYHGALSDFDSALEHMDKADKVNRVRTISFIALCHIDIRRYSEALVHVVTAIEENSNLLKEFMNQITVEKDEVLYCQRTTWILFYHQALCLYMLQATTEAQRIMEKCIEKTTVIYAPDESSIGTIYFFLGQLHMLQQNFAEALSCFQYCSNLHWADTQNHRYLLDFAIGKVLQSLKQHQAAIDQFSIILNQYPDDPYSYFRRAWSHKAIGNFVAAGDDFETAKRLRPDDPNFAIDYKKISKYEFMIIGTEPDLIEPFPSLLPVPGLHSR